MGRVRGGGDPGFSEEFNDGVWTVLRDFLAPALFRAGDLEPQRVEAAMASAREPDGESHARERVPGCVAPRAGDSLASFLGADRRRVECGVSVGIAPSADALLEQVDGYLAEGTGGSSSRSSRARTSSASGPCARRTRTSCCRSMRTPRTGSRTSRSSEPSTPSTCSWSTQPLHHDDLVEHAALQRQIRTDLCLDESVRSAADARAAIDLGSCRIVNIKQGRGGGSPRGRARPRRLPRPRRAGLQRDARDRYRQGNEPGVAALPGFTSLATLVSRSLLRPGPHRLHVLAPTGR